MADGWQTYPVEFRGGLVTNLSPIQQGINLPGSARQLRNFEPSVEGGYRRILGFQKFDSNAVTGATNALMRGVHYYSGNVYAVRNNASGGQGELYKSGGSGWTRITTDSIRFSATNTKVRFAKYNFNGTEKIFMVDGSNTPLYYDGTTIAQLPANAAYNNSSHVAVYRDHIFVAKGGTSLAFSSLLSDTDWTAGSGAGEYQFSDTITGLQVFRDTLFIFTKTQIHKLQGTTSSDFVRQPVSTDLGCVQEDTIQEIGGDVIFMGPDGLRLLSATERIGDVGLGSITKNIQSEATDFLNGNSSFSSLVVRGKSQYRIFGFDSGDALSESQGLIATQFASQGGEGIAWSETRGIKAFSAYGEYSGTEEFLFFAHTDGYVYRLEQGISFDSTDIDASFFTPYLPVSDPTIRKTIYVAHNYVDPDGNFSASMAIDYDFNTGIRPSPITLSNNIASSGEIGIYGTSVYGTGIFGEALQVQLRDQLTGSGFVVSLEYTSTGSTQPFSLDAVALEYATESRR